MAAAIITTLGDVVDDESRLLLLLCVGVDELFDPEQSQPGELLRREMMKINFKRIFN
jgi:hypothetical protein